MWNALSISASGLAASAAQFTRAASKVVSAFNGEPGSPTPAQQQQPAPSAPQAAPAAPPLAGATAVTAQEQAPASWMVEILKAKAAYRADAAAYNAASQVQKQTIDLIG